jgi:hypothetical protein
LQNLLNDIENNDTENNLKESITAFPIETQDIVLKLHRRLMDFGFKCEMKTKRFSTTGNFFLYSYKRKSIEDIWIIRVTSDACGIRFNAKHAFEYVNVIENLPSSLLEIIKTGEGCIYNPTPEHCQIGSEGIKYSIRFSINGKQYLKCNSKCCAACDFWIPLTNLTNELSQAIENWINVELSYL